MSKNATLFEPIPGWVVILLAFCFLVVMIVLLVLYMPRNEEIRRLRGIIKDQKAKIKTLSEGATQEHLEHVADVGELSEQVLDAQSETQRVRKESEKALAEQSSRTEQEKRQNAALARSADQMLADLRKKAEFQKKHPAFVTSELP